MSKVCVLLTDNVEEIEALTVVDICRRADINLSMVSVTGNIYVTGSHNITIKADELVSDIDFKEVDMIVLPGGPGAKNLELCNELMKQVDLFNEQGRYISAICGAPGILGRRNILNGKKACCYPSVEDQLKGAILSHKRVEVDGHILTSRGMGTAVEFALSIVERLKGFICAQELKRKIIYEQD